MYDFTLTGLFNTNVETVYNAFNDPTVLVKWFAPGNLVVSQFISDFAEGGNYRAVLQSPDGFQQTVIGTYQEIEHNNHLSFTWRWDDTNDITKVNVFFTSMPNLSTRVTLTQSGFHQEQEMTHQQYNWLACLEKLSLATWDASANNQPLVA
ncbi:MAG: hypothetical protein ACI94Z_000596 [Yoonia sp.]|jgi:uncharacterized protein YndB with AHSA1/START domain